MTPEVTRTPAVPFGVSVSRTWLSLPIAAKSTMPGEPVAPFVTCKELTALAVGLSEMMAKPFASKMLVVIRGDVARSAPLLVVRFVPSEVAPLIPPNELELLY